MKKQIEKEAKANNVVIEKDSIENHNINQVNDISVNDNGEINRVE